MLTDKEQKMAMSDAQLYTCERQARGEEAYQGKITRSETNTILRTNSSL